jgi:hypothetical protein
MKAMCRKLMAMAISLAIVTSATHASAANKCAMDKEYAALNLRALQTELMVAALTCQKKAEYNAVVMKHKPVFAKKSRDFRSYFSRTAGGRTDFSMNQFVTRLANAASERSLKESVSEYCQTASSLFKNVLQSDGSNLQKLVTEPRFASLHGITGCSAPKTEKQVASRQ